MMLFSTAEVEVLNTARRLLQDIDKRAGAEAWALKHGDEGESQYDQHDLGRLSESASVAENAIFSVLNTASSYLHLDVDLGLRKGE